MRKDQVGPRDDQQSFGHDQQSELNCNALLYDQYTKYRKSDHVWPRYNLNLNPLILNPLLNKWSICDQMIVGLLQNRLVWLSRDPYEMNAFGIFRIGHHKLLIPRLYPL